MLKPHFTFTLIFSSIVYLITWKKDEEHLFLIRNSYCKTQKRKTHTYIYVSYIENKVLNAKIEHKEKEKTK